MGSRLAGYEQFGGYMGFIVPGLVMMAVITASFSNVVSSFFGAKFQKNHEEMLVSPTPNWVILAGYSMGGVIRGLLIGFVVFLVSLFFVPKLQVNNVFIIIFVCYFDGDFFLLGRVFQRSLCQKIRRCSDYSDFCAHALDLSRRSFLPYQPASSNLASRVAV